MLFHLTYIFKKEPAGQITIEDKILYPGFEKQVLYWTPLDLQVTSPGIDLNKIGTGKLSGEGEDQKMTEIKYPMVEKMLAITFAGGRPMAMDAANNNREEKEERPRQTGRITFSNGYMSDTTVILIFLALTALMGAIIFGVFNNRAFMEKLGLNFEPKKSFQPLKKHYARVLKQLNKRAEKQELSRDEQVSKNALESFLRHL